jgi:hypothetical protein
MKPKNVLRSHWLQYNTLFFLEHILGEKWYPKIFSETEKRLYKKIDEHVTKHPVEDDFQILEFKEGNYPEPFCHPYFPMVYRGIAKDWPSAKKWSLDFFDDAFGDTDVTLINNAGLTKDTDQAYDVIKFREYIKRMKSGSKDYLKFSRIVEEQSSLRDDFDYAWLRKFRTKFAQNDLFYFFMGAKDTITPIHDGYAITVFVQVKGSKKWVFYPCNQRLFIGARPRRYNYFYSEADPYVLDDPKFPLMKHAKPHVIEVHEGDVLYFPSLVWHQVENTTDSIGVAYKFASIPSGFISSKMLAICFFLATKPWLIETLMPWRSDTYNYKKSVSKNNM